MQDIKSSSVLVLASSSLSAVSAAPLHNRPGYVQGIEDDQDDVFDVVSVSPPFKYVIPTFDVLTVELRHMTIIGQHISSGDKARYDLLIRSDPSLTRSYPVRMTV